MIPAFETQKYRSKIPKNKKDLIEMLDNRRIYTFRYDVWASGHAATNYTKWRTAKLPYVVSSFIYLIILMRISSRNSNFQ